MTRVSIILLASIGIHCSLVFQKAEADCRTSVKGMQLANRVMSALNHIGDSNICYRTCAAISGCQSINYYKDKSLCELNSRTIENSPHMTVFKGDSVYFKIQEPLPPPVLKNCAEFRGRGFKESDVYTIDPDGKGKFEVVCDQNTAGGGWTVFQKRIDGSVNFYRGWDDYKNGFGDLKGEFWLGFDKINRLLNETRNRLRVELEDWEGNSVYAEYDFITVSSERDNYTLSIGNYTGTAGDSLSYHSGLPFSTKDRDNDQGDDYSCAVDFKGAWWYKSCYLSNLNGVYRPQSNHTSSSHGVSWAHWKDHYYSLKRTEMKIKPV